MNQVVSKPAAPKPAPHSAATPIPPELADLALIDIKTVTVITGLKETSIYDRLRKGQFPEPVRLGARCTRWTVASIKQWLQEQIEAQSQQGELKAGLQARAMKASSAAQAKRKVVRATDTSALTRVEVHHE